MQGRGGFPSTSYAQEAFVLHPFEGAEARAFALASVPDLHTPGQDRDYISKIEDVHVSSSDSPHSIAKEVHCSECALCLSCHFLCVGIPEQLTVHPNPQSMNGFGGSGSKMHS